MAHSALPAATNQRRPSLKSQVLETASTEKVSIHVNTNCGDYNGTPIACRMSISLPWFLSTGWHKEWHHFLHALTLPNINRFSKLFHCRNQDKIYYNTITNDPTTPHVCLYTHYIMKF